jgi:hypothetical protein
VLELTMMDDKRGGGRGVAYAVVVSAQKHMDFFADNGKLKMQSAKVKYQII